MSRKCCRNESSCCNNSCCNLCDGYGNGVLGLGSSWVYILAILLIFGGGAFSPGSFWSGYNNIFRCSGFNNGWCTDTASNNFNNSSFNTSNSVKSIPNTNLSTANLAGLLGGLSGNSNFDIGDLTKSFN